MIPHKDPPGGIAHDNPAFDHGDDATSGHDNVVIPIDNTTDETETDQHRGGSVRFAEGTEKEKKQRPSVESKRSVTPPPALKKQRSTSLTNVADATDGVPVSFSERPRPMTETSILMSEDPEETQAPLLWHPSHSSASNMDPKTGEDIGRLLDAAGKPKKSLKEGFYSEDTEDIPHHHVDERDYENHRRGDYPHSHHLMSPAAPHHHKQHHHHHHKPRHHHKRHRKRAISESGHIPPEVAEELPPHGEEDEPDGDEEAPSEDLQPKPKPLPPVASQDNLENKHVHFFIGDETGTSASRDDVHKGISVEPHAKEKEPQKDEQPTSDAQAALAPGKHHHHHHRHHHHHHRVPTEQELANRRLPGSQVTLGGQRKISLQQEEDDVGLPAADLENITSHRSTAGFHRKRHKHSGMTSVVHIGHSEKDGEDKVLPAITKPKIDHSPHDRSLYSQMFVELDEILLGEDEEYTWKERARWIKFEENVEEGTNKFGKPHVSSLSFHSLLELRRCIEHGVISLDLDKQDLPSIVTHVVDQLVLEDYLPPEEKGAVLKALLLKHRHVSSGRKFSLNRIASFSGGDLERGILSRHRHEKKHGKGSWAAPRLSLSDIRTLKDDSSASLSSLPNMYPPEKSDEHTDNLNKLMTGHTPFSNGRSGSFTVKFSSDKNGSASPSIKNAHPSFSRRESHAIMRRIPEGSEATTVLVGSVLFLQQPVMAFVRLSEGCFLGNLTEVPLPVRFLFILMGPPNQNMDYVEIGRSISTLMANTTFHDTAYKADDREDLLTALNEFLNDSIVLPPGEWDHFTKDTLLPTVESVRRKQIQTKKLAKEGLKVYKKKDTEDEYDPLRRTKKIFGGVINDIKFRYPLYLSDIKDGLNPLCLATIFFIYFACLSPAITFGGLISEVTEQWMGVNELLLGTAIFGLMFALFAAQPLTIIGATGPILIFEGGLFQITSIFGLEYITVRFWVMIWLAVIIFIFVAFDGSVFVRLFTRFTQEIFATLISLIFIFEVFNKLAKVFAAHPLESCYADDTSSIILSLMNDTNTTVMPFNATDSVTDNLTLWSTTELIPTDALNDTCDSGAAVTASLGEPNTALLSFILTFSTFALAWGLKNFRNSKFLGRGARRALGDFGVPIAIFTMVIVDIFIHDVYTEKLYVPDGLQVTSVCKRGWFINPMGMHQPLPVWGIFVAMIPALLVFILIFMESEITMLILNKKDRRLKKGSGYHADLALIGICAIIAGVLGLPMICAATVRTVSHVSALSVYSRDHAPGEKPKLEEVKEQRVTAFFVHILIGISMMMGPILRQVPLAVLFGVFLYMGVASLTGIQLMDRIYMVFMPTKHHLDVGYVRHVKTWKMNLFTGIQFLVLAVLWAVKSTEAALAFPFVLLLTMPMRRYLLGFFFTTTELKWLDKDDELEEEDEEELDFYEQAPMHY